MNEDIKGGKHYCCSCIVVAKNAHQPVVLKFIKTENIISIKIIIMYDFYYREHGVHVSVKENQSH